ncbi:MAG: hypothetical protein WAN51_08940 [Alphaproteobacteria bacterium]
MFRKEFAIAVAAGVILAAADAPAQNTAMQSASAQNPGAHEDPPAATSALFIYQFIVNRLAFFEECAQIDKPNISAYSEAFSNFSLDATPIADRAFAILHDESARAKETSDSFSRRMFDVGRDARKELMDNAEKNSIAFTIGCRMAPPAMREHAEGFKPIRNQFPDHMQAIDAWK